MLWHMSALQDEKEERERERERESFGGVICARRVEKPMNQSEKTQL